MIEIEKLPERAKDLEEFETYVLPFKDGWSISLMRFESKPMAWCYMVHLLRPDGRQEQIKKYPGTDIFGYNAERWSYKAAKGLVSEALKDHANIDLNDEYGYTSSN